MTTHLIQSTLAALIATVLVFALRRRSAALRHTVLLAALLRFLIPTPWLTQAGTRLASCLPSRVPVVEDLSKLLRHPPETPALAIPVLSQGLPGARAVPWVWTIGTLLLLVFWLRGLLKRIPEVRAVNEAEHAAWQRLQCRVTLRIIPSGLSPGARGLLRPAILLPDGLSSHLSQAELDSVLTHELAHIQRKDNWASAAARIVACLFWFHPLLWWMERRMLRERETACDQWVLSRGIDKTDYVAAIAKVCRLAWDRSPSYAGMADSNLKQRMETIMTSPWKFSTSSFLKVTLAAIATVAILLPVTSGFLQAQPPALSHTAADQLYQACLGHLKAGRFAEAEEGYRRLIEQEPDNPRGHIGIWITYLRQGREEEAMRLAEDLVQRNPNSFPIGRAVGYFYWDAKKFDQAIEEFKNLLVIAPDSQTLASVYSSLGAAYREAGNLNLAMDAFRQSLALKTDAQTMLQLALLLEGTGQKEAARQEYAKVLEIDPANPIALNNLAYLMSEGGDLSRATHYALMAREAMPNSPDIADTVGWLYLKRQMADEAIAVLRQAVVAAPSNPDFRGHLASAIELKGLNSPSIKELTDALRTQNRPDDKERILSLLAALP